MNAQVKRNKTKQADGVDRRSFLIGTAASGLVMGFVDPLKIAGGIKDANAAIAQFEPTVWYGIDGKGHVTLNVGKAEMGQHVGSALAQIVAEELEVDHRHIKLNFTGNDPRYNDPGLGALVTGGSWSIFMNFQAMSKAGAAGRITLIEAGAGMLGVPAGDCHAKLGKVVAKNGKSVSYGEIISKGKPSKVWTADELKAVTVKSFADYKVIGKSLPALDVPSKTNGTAKYGIDTFVKGMVYATLVTPPVRYGAKVKSVDDSGAKKVKGFIKAIPLDDKTGTSTGWVSVVASNFPAALKAAAALKVDWDLGPHANVSSESILAESKRLQAEGTKGLLWVKDGDAGTAIGGAAKKLEAEYTTSLNIHAPLEPMNAVVYKDGESWHVHTGNQFSTRSTALMAGSVGGDPKNAVHHQKLLGGGFGRRLEGDMNVAAALTSAALGGKPVKLIYSREADMQVDFTRPLTYQKVRAGLDANGKLLGMEHDVISSWPTARWGIPAFLTPSVDKKGSLDSFTVNGSDFWYSVPNHTVRNFLNELAQAATPSGQLRSVAPAWTFWAVESFMDELAHAAGKDPVAYRLAMLDGAGKNAGGAERLASVLKMVTAKAGWGKKQMAKNSAMGVACVSAQERGTATWTACVAEVAINPANGAIDLKKLTIGMDVGTAVNPDGVRAQIEGSSLWGVSLALYEQATMKKGGLEQRNYDSYTPLRMSQVPELDIHIISSGKPATGCGEPAVTVVAPAIANAVFNAVGARVRSLPITPAAVKAAMKA